MTYEEAVTYILDIPKFTRKNDAVHTKTLLRLLGILRRRLKLSMWPVQTVRAPCALTWMLCSVQKENGPGFLLRPIL